MQESIIMISVFCFVDNFSVFTHTLPCGEFLV